MARLRWGGVGMILGVFGGEGGVGSEGAGLTLYPLALVLAVLLDRNITQPCASECETDSGITNLCRFRANDDLCSARMAVCRH